MHPIGDGPEIGMVCGEFRCPFRFVGWLPIQSVSNPICAAVKTTKISKNPILLVEFWVPKTGSCQFLCSGPKNGTPKFKNPILDVPKTGVDVDFCAAVPKCDPKIPKILFFTCQNRGHVDFCALCRFGTTKIQKSYS